MTKYIKITNAFFKKLRTLITRAIFCNIAEGTHAGRISMQAKSEISQANLLVKFSDGGIAVCSQTDAPIGVCSDMGKSGDILDVALGACAESTLLCVAASAIAQGDVLYTSANGKVGTSAVAGAHKVGLALNAASAGGAVEVDPQNFGAKAFQIFAAGVHTWAGGAALTDEISISSIKSGDIAFAMISTAGTGSATAVKASIDSENSKIKFTIDQNGVDASTILNWMIVRNA